MPPALSLADIAAAQVNNPNNPWAPQQPNAAQSAYIAGLTPPANPAQANYLAGLAPSAKNPNSVMGAMIAGTNVGPDDAGSFGPPTPNEAEKAYDAKAKQANEPIATTGVGSSGPSGPSPDRKWLAEQSRIGDERDKLYDNDKQSLYKDQAIREIGTIEQRDLAAKQNIDFQVHQNEMQSALRESDAKRATRMRELEAEAESLRNEKVDPQHWWKQKGTAGSILAAISIGLGAFGAAMPHTNSNQNAALGIINNAIDRDIDAQKSTLANKWKALSSKTEFANNDFVREQWMYNQQNELAYKAYDHVNNMLAQRRVQTQDQLQASAIDRMMSETQQKKLDVASKIADQGREVATKERQAAAAAAAANPYSRVNTEKAYQKYREAAEKANLEHPDKPVPIMPQKDWLPTYQGKGMARPQASGPNGAKSSDALGSLDELDKTIDRMNDIYADLNYANSPAGRAELDQLKRNAALAYPKSQTGSTRINENELKKGEETFGVPGTWINSDLLGQKKAGLKVMKDQAADRRKRILKEGTAGSSDTAKEE